MALGWRKEYTRYKDYFLNIVAIYKQKQDLKMFMEILLSLATVSFFAVFALKPTLVTIAGLAKEINSKEETVAKLDTKIQNLTTAQTILDQELTRLPLIEEAVPQAPSPETFVRQIEGLAVKNSVSLLGISIGQVTLLGESKGPKKADTGLAPLPEEAKGVSFSLSIAGEYSRLAAFIADLEKLRRPIAVDSTGISTSETDEGKVLVVLVSGRVPYITQK